jgi:DNA-binding HxlR family transcriptional regulator
VTTGSAGQPRPDERVTYDAYLKGCPASQLLASISNRWVSLAICALGERSGPVRYSALSRRIPGVSQKMLTQTLRALERDGLLARTVTAEVPVRVEYELTELGQSLHGLLSSVKDWAEANIHKVNEARARHDAQHMHRQAN